MVGRAARRRAVSFFARSSGSYVGRIGPGAELEPGMTWLLSVDVDGGGQRSSLWRLEPGEPDGTKHFGFQGRALRALDVADSHARRELPVLGDPSALARATPWRARLVLQRGEGQERVLDGSSFGLAMTLGAISRLVGLPLPTALVACAAVSESGRIEEVGGLENKLGLLSDSSLAATLPKLTLLVAPGQERLARECAPPGTSVLAVQDLAEATAATFGEHLTARLVERWHAEGSQEQAVGALYRLALGGSSRLLQWRAVASLLAHLLDASDDPAWRWRAEIAHGIAARHTGAHAPLTLQPGLLAGLRRPDRLELLAHATQAAADSPDQPWREAVDLGWTHVAQPGEEHAQDLKLLGALGRTLAAWGQYDEAQGALGRAIRGWLDLDLVPQASYPLCELLRVQGVLGQALDGEVEQAVERVRRDLRTELIARAFLALARGRALCQLGDEAGALVELGDASTTRWDHTPIHVRASRLRWFACALAGGEPERAASLRAELGPLALRDPEGAGFAAPLAALDQGDLAGVAVLAQHPKWGPDAQRILEFTTTTDAGVDEQSWALRTHWRY